MGRDTNEKRTSDMTAEELEALSDEELLSRFRQANQEADDWYEENPDPER